MTSALPLAPPAGWTRSQTVVPVAWAVGAVLALAMVAPSAFSALLLVDWTDSVERAVVGAMEAFVVLWWAASASRAAVPSLRRGPARIAVVTGATMLLAVAAAPHAAPALVRTAEWMLHAAFGLIVWAEAGRGDAGVVRAWRRGSLLGFAFVMGAAIGLWAWLSEPAAYPWRVEFPFLNGVRWIGTYGLVAICLPAAVRGAAPRTVLAWQAAGWLAVWWSGSRGALGGAALAALLLVALSPQRRRTAATMLAAAAVGALLSLPVSMPEHLMGLSRLWNSTVGGDGVSFGSGRGELWQTTFAAWQTRPWLGIGPDGVLPVVAPLGAAHAHNTVLQALAEGGVVAGVPFLVALGAMLAAAARAALQTRDAVRVGAAAYLVALMANGLLDGILYDPGSTMLTAAAFGVALAPADLRRPASRTVTPASLRAAALAGLVVMVLHGAVLRAVWAPGTPAPGSWRPALVRAFPSAPVLSPMAAWGRLWHADAPEAALDLATWGAQQGRSPWLFWRLAADVLAPTNLPAARDATARADRSQAQATRFRAL